MKTQSDILSMLSNLRDCLIEAHQDEINNRHHGDEGTCSYCEAIRSADNILAVSSSPDDEGNEAPAHRTPCHHGGTSHNFPHDGVCTDCGAGDPSVVKVVTDDGYTFVEQADGSWGDGDQSWGRYWDMIEDFYKQNIGFTVMRQKDIDNAERGAADQAALKQMEREDTVFLHAGFTLRENGGDNLQWSKALREDLIIILCNEAGEAPSPDSDLCVYLVKGYGGETLMEETMSYTELPKMLERFTGMPCIA